MPTMDVNGPVYSNLHNLGEVFLRFDADTKIKSDRETGPGA